MKNLIFALFLWVLFLLAINALQNDTTKKRVSELEREVSNYEYQIFQLKKDIEYIKNPYLEVF
ncbi:hypothetical protein [Brachyspira catarrhinii]|uniref:Uncharacterized protein n=1 Tax=Brachyspira catarrhinii TaxID=2528966 RepID=A0ABY2TQ75_9SPIR|nr:hypothetical protein [Brachyspira catarrhinii]TKZ34808.1 hypothetical protein EZH24_07615 [Brachyspira catarrhinii]